MPATPALHHQQHRPLAAPAPTRRDHPRASPTRQRPAIPDRLPPAPAHGRTLDLLARRRRQPATALPRNHPEQPVAAPPRRRTQPAPPTRPRTDPHRRRLDDGLNTTTPGLDRPADPFHPGP